MRSISICSKDIEQEADVVHKDTLLMEGVTLHCAYLELEDIVFNPTREDHRFSLLVRKIGFSANYRDKGLILGAAKAYEDNPEEVKNSEIGGIHVPFGSDYVAIVEQVGIGVTGFAKGDRVINCGSYPSRFKTPTGPEAQNYHIGLPTNYASQELEIVHFKKVVRVPEGMSNTVAAAFGIGGMTSMSMVRKLNIQPGENVLVTAAKSNTSLFSINQLKYRDDITLYAASTSEKFSDELKEMGVNEMLYVENTMELFTQESLQKVPWEGFDSVIDPMWDLYLGRLNKYIGVGGKYTTCGVVDQYSEITQQEFYGRWIPPTPRLIGDFMFGSKTLIGNCLGDEEDLVKAIDQHVNGRYDVLIDSAYTQPNEITDLLISTYSDPNRWGKVVFLYE